MLTTAEAGLAPRAASGMDAVRLARLEDEITRLRTEVEQLRGAVPDNRASFCLISGDYDRVLAVLMMAQMAAALEMETSIFFSFWGVQAIRQGRRFQGKTLVERATAAMLKADIRGLSSSKFNFGGLGPAMFDQIMRAKRIATPAELLAGTGEAGIRLMACTTSMEVFGIGADELMPGVTLCGAAQYLETASRCRVSLCL